MAKTASLKDTSLAGSRPSRDIPWLSAASRSRLSGDRLARIQRHTLPRSRCEAEDSPAGACRLLAPAGIHLVTRVALMDRKFAVVTPVCAVKSRRPPALTA